ncbi:MAG: hypothetical protein U0163_10160 [Gemmatimonadaceae bacterium]
MVVPTGAAPAGTSIFTAPLTAVTVAPFALTIAPSATVTVALTLLPSALAVIVAVPAVNAVTNPVELTVATAGAPLVHAMGRLDREAPDASLAVAVSCNVCPATSDSAVWSRVSVAIGASTVRVAEPERASLEAVTCAVPTASAVTRPDVLTDATSGALLDHVTVRPLSALPDASFAVAVS